MYTEVTFKNVPHPSPTFRAAYLHLTFLVYLRGTPDSCVTHTSIHRWAPVYIQSNSSRGYVDCTSDWSLMHLPASTFSLSGNTRQLQSFKLAVHDYGICCQSIEHILEEHEK